MILVFFFLVSLLAIWIPLYFIFYIFVISSCLGSRGTKSIKNFDYSRNFGGETNKNWKGIYKEDSKTLWVECFSEETVGRSILDERSLQRSDSGYFYQVEIHDWTWERTLPCWGDSTTGNGWKFGAKTIASKTRQGRGFRSKFTWMWLTRPFGELGLEKSKEKDLLSPAPDQRAMLQRSRSLELADAVRWQCLVQTIEISGAVMDTKASYIQVSYIDWVELQLLLQVFVRACTVLLLTVLLFAYFQFT